jgi:hypothetical protein
MPPRPVEQSVSNAFSYCSPLSNFFLIHTAPIYWARTIAKFQRRQAGCRPGCHSRSTHHGDDCGVPPPAHEPDHRLWPRSPADAAITGCCERASDACTRGRCALCGRERAPILGRLIVTLTYACDCDRSTPLIQINVPGCRQETFSVPPATAAAARHSDGRHASTFAACSHCLPGCHAGVGRYGLR